MERRNFLKLACAVPFMGPVMAQMASNPSNLEKLRAISLRIMNAQTVFHVQSWAAGVWWHWISKVRPKLGIY